MHCDKTDKLKFRQSSKTHIMTKLKKIKPSQLKNLNFKTNKRLSFENSKTHIRTSNKEQSSKPK